MSLQSSRTVQLHEINNQVSVIEINRPESLNALNMDVLQGLMLALDQLSEKEALRVLILRGAGEKAFVAGADIAGMADLGPRAIADYVELGQRVMRSIETLRVPVIAAVDGYALGGGLELALSADIIFASSAARVGQPEVNLGIIPGFGGTQRLLQRCSIGTVRRLVYGGEIIGAQEALQLGIVDKVVEVQDFEQKLTEFSELVASKAPLAVQGAKRVIREYQESHLLGGLRKEVEMFLELFGSADREEGMQAFLQKRKADFVGK